MTDAVCNGHGRPSDTSVTSIENVKCECDKGYGGKFCDYCTDAGLAYPDCDPASNLSSSIYDTKTTRAFLERRKYDQKGY